MVLAALAAALCALSFCFFIVDQAEHAVVTQFGEPVQVVTTPGLGLKLPYQSVQKFDSRLFVYAPPLGEFLTLEKTAVVASGAILWRIAEPRKYFETVFDRTGAEARLSDILFAELGAAIGRSPLDAFVSSAPAAYRADALLEAVSATLAGAGAARLRHRTRRRPAAALRLSGAQPAARLCAYEVGARAASA